MSNSPEASPSQGAAQHTGSRRRFIKGAALGTPAVLTLRSGGLAALSVPCSERFGGTEEIHGDGATNAPTTSCALSVLP